MDIFLLEIESANNIEAKLLKQFQKKEISNLHKLNQHCFSYLMTDRILKDFYQIENPEIVLKNKKPFLKSGKKFFSISHSEDLIALAFSDFDCGIDIEKNKPRDFIEISKRMGFHCDSLKDFYLEWTKYEAEYKLGETAKKYKNFQLKDYTIAACSKNIQEKFEIYIQNEEVFSNVNN